jgi:hypothetical protein
MFMIQLMDNLYFKFSIIVFLHKHGMKYYSITNKLFLNLSTSFFFMIGRIWILREKSFLKINYEEEGQ